MMRRTLLLVPLALFAACDKAPAGDGLVSQGNWTADLTIDSIDVPGMRPETIEGYKKRWEIHRSKCITLADTRTPDRLLFGRPDSCEYSRQKMAGGKISATMNCEQPGMTQTIQLEGDYQPERYTLHVNGMVEDRSEGQTVSYVATLEARRTGACTPA